MKDIELENKIQVRELQEQYMQTYINNLPILINERKNEICNKLDEFNKNYVQVKYDKFDNAERITNPMLIKTFFFKPLNPLSTHIPQYTGEQLGILYDLYQDLVEKINVEIAPFSPDINHFCRFIGITKNELLRYKNSSDILTKTIIEKLYDFCRDGNLTLAQNGIYKERITVFKAKSELEMSEKVEPRVNINVEASLDTDSILKRAAEIRELNSKDIIKKNGKKIIEAKYE